MAVTPSYLSYVLDQFSGAGEVVSRRMFGGVGLYRDGVFFGAVDDDAVYMRVDEATRPEYERRGMPMLRPLKSKPDLVMQAYFQLPPEILDDREVLHEWLERAVRAAVAAAKPKRPPSARTRKPKAASARKRT
ncbi:MAG TPA: TfoX/Sxy family protein [Polyangiaceae bacterium]|nr:TfoX/Sxy family protein [Polyangiaceae bacterium]